MLRFNLKRLLALVTVVALLLCAAQVHRRNLLRQIEQLEAAGASFRLSDGWTDALWMKRPCEARIVMGLNPSTGRLQLGSHELEGVDSSGGEIALLKQKLADFGVFQVNVVYAGRRGPRGNGHQD